MDSVLQWQLVIILSVVASRINSEKSMFVIALGWTVWTLLALNNSPILYLQLLTTWGTVCVVTWLTWIFHRSSVKTNKTTPSTDTSIKPVEKPSDNALNKIESGFTTGLNQLNNFTARVNEYTQKEVEKDELNRDFLMKLHNFTLSVKHAMKMAESKYESDSLYENEPDKRKLYEETLKEIKNILKEGDDSDYVIKLSKIPMALSISRISHSTLAIDQRKVKIQECLVFITEVEKRLSEKKHLSKYVDEITDKGSFNLFLSLQKKFLKQHLSMLAPEKAIKEQIASSLTSLQAQSANHVVTGHPEVVFSDEKICQKNIKMLVEARGIEYLVHFTRIENLPSIIEKGLIGRRSLQSNNVESLVNDNLRLDNVSDAISTSISFPNYKMFYSLQMQSMTSDWAVIKLDPSILWELDCAFCSRNAAAKSSTALSLEDRRSHEALVKMFDENNADVTRNSLKIPDNYPTDPQAEVLVLETVSPKYILGIDLNDKEKIKNFPLTASIVGPYVNSVKFYYEPFMFGPRQDYEYWKPARSEYLQPEQGNPYIRDIPF